MTVVYFDLETGGVTDAHPDIQIAAIAVRDRREISTFERKIQFREEDADPEALAMNHYDPAVWAERAVPQSSAMQQFADFCRQFACITKTSRAGRPYSVCRLAGHNAASFDFPRISAACKRFGIFLPADYLVLDTLQAALWHFHRIGQFPENLKLGTLAAHFGIPSDGAHDALADVRMCARLAEALTKGGGA